MKPNAREILGDEEYKRLVALGDSIFQEIPIEVLRAHIGKRIAIDLKTRECRYFDGSTPSDALACTGPTWTSIVRIREIVLH